MASKSESSCDICGKTFYPTNDEETCNVCISMMIEASLQTYSASKTTDAESEKILADRELREKQDEEFAIASRTDRQREKNIKKCSVCLEYSQIKEGDICSNCLQIFQESSQEVSSADDIFDDTVGDLPTEREERAAMLASQYEKLFS